MYLNLLEREKFYYFLGVYLHINFRRPLNS